MTVYILSFEKMHGLGNDFIMLERRFLPNGVDEKKLAIQLCDRNFGIGADGIIIVDLSPSRDADFVWEYINSDGSYAEMCGNGMRCFAKYVFEKGFTDERTFKVLTRAGLIVPTIEIDGTVTVDIGIPLLPKTIKETIKAGDKDFTYTYIETGNPHCVIFFDEDIDPLIFNTYGPILEKHSNFPKGVNVEFAYVKNRNEINCKVWERGCGPTLACGTGACATVIASNLNGLTDEKASINLPGGRLDITWNKDTNHVFLNGPADFVFIGNYNLDPATVCMQISRK